MLRERVKIPTLYHVGHSRRLLAARLQDHRTALHAALTLAYSLRQRRRAGLLELNCRCPLGVVAKPRGVAHLDLRHDRHGCTVRCALFAADTASVLRTFDGAPLMRSEAPSKVLKCNEEGDTTPVSVHRHNHRKVSVNRTPGTTSTRDVSYLSTPPRSLKIPLRMYLEQGSGSWMYVVHAAPEISHPW